MTSLGSFSLIGREKEMELIREAFNKFVRLNDFEKQVGLKMEEQKDRPNQFRRKSSAPLISRSMSSNGLPTARDSFEEIPRIVVEGDGGLGKSSLLGYIRDLALQENFSVWYNFH